MWIDRISFAIILFLLVRHLIRIVRVWRATHMVAVTSALFIPAMALLLVALLTEHDWTKWVAGALLILIAIWKFRGPGAILDQCEDGLVLGGIPYAEMVAFSREQDEKREWDDAREERDRLIEEDRGAWWEAFAVEARPREISFSIQLEEAVSLETDEPDHPLNLGPGAVALSLGEWRTIEDHREEVYEIHLRLGVEDTDRISWERRYAATIEDIVELGFSSEPKRLPGELEAWTQVDAAHERAFREHCLVSKAVYHTDQRDRISIRIGYHDYEVVTKYSRGVIDLAWEPVTGCFLLRLAGLHHRNRNGDDRLEIPDGAHGPVATVWDPDQIEPVVFPILPEELLPFGPHRIPESWRLDPELDAWTKPFTRRNSLP